MSTLAGRAARQFGEPTPLAKSQAKRGPSAPEAKVLAAVVGILAFALGLWLEERFHLIVGDALSRVASAFYVVASRDPHLAALGFVWNPLPSLLELPFVFLHGIIPALVTDGIAALVLTAFSGGLAAYFLANILADFGIERRYRIPVTLAFALNPVILLYTVNGMSEMMMLAAMLGAVEGVAAYLNGGTLRKLTSAAVWLAIGFGIRYEAVPIALLMTLGAVIGLHRSGRDASVLRGTGLLLLSPMVYAVGLWVYANWLIMKNPLYFLNSSYSNSAQTATGTYAAMLPVLISLRHHLLASAAFVGFFTLLFWPVIPGLVMTAWIALRDRSKDARALTLLGTALGAPLLQVVMIYAGKSASWTRFFIYYIPMGVVLMMYAVQRLSEKRPRRALLLWASVLVLLLGDAGTFVAVNDSPVLGHGVSYMFQSVAHNKALSTGIPWNVVAYLNAHPHLTVLMDSFEAYSIIIEAKHPKQFVITSDRDFKSILENPKGRVDAFLVPSPTSALATADAVNRAWPQLWAGKVPWAHLVKSFGGSLQYRLYRVGSSAP